MLLVFVRVRPKSHSAGLIGSRRLAVATLPVGLFQQLAITAAGSQLTASPTAAACPVKSPGPQLRPSSLFNLGLLAASRAERYRVVQSYVNSGRPSTSYAPARRPTVRLAGYSRYSCLR